MNTTKRLLVALAIAATLVGGGAKPVRSVATKTTIATVAKR